MIIFKNPGNINNGKKKKRVIRFFFFFTAFAALIFLLPVNKRLICVSGGKIIYVSENLNRFSIGYTHSVNKSPVEDFFKISGSRLELEKTVFFSFGAGMDIISAHYELTDGGMTITHSGKFFDSLTYRTASEAGLFFKSEDERFYLEDISPVFSAVTFRVGYVNVLDILKAGGNLLL